MKILLNFMIFLIVFSIPLSILGFTLTPSFTFTYSSLSSVLKTIDNPIVKVFTKPFLGDIKGVSTYSWLYDYNLLQDQINSEKYYYLVDVRYIVYYPYEYSDYDAVYLKAWSTFNQTMNLAHGRSYDNKLKIYLCFDENGIYLRSLIISRKEVYTSTSSFDLFVNRSIYNKLQNKAYVIIDGSNHHVLAPRSYGSISKFVNAYCKD